MNRPVQLPQPTMCSFVGYPADAELTVTSQVIELSEDQRKLHVTLEAEERVCAGEWLVCCGEGRASCFSPLVVTSWSTPAPSQVKLLEELQEQVLDAMHSIEKVRSMRLSRLQPSSLAF